jgi:hypothetical protein
MSPLRHPVRRRPLPPHCKGPRPPRAIRPLLRGHPVSTSVQHKSQSRRATTPLNLSPSQQALLPISNPPLQLNQRQLRHQQRV